VVNTILVNTGEIFGCERRKMEHVVLTT